MTPRLYRIDFKANTPILLNEKEKHYLLNVLRLKADDQVIIFNENEGEWLCKINFLSKKQVELVCMQQMRVVKNEPKTALAFSPLKPEALGFLLEKSTELGVTDFYPLITSYSHVKSLNIERCLRIITEALEQSERLQRPQLHPLCDLKSFLNALPKEYSWHAGMERSDNTPSLSKALIGKPHDASLGLIIGPEGGFSKDEKHLLINHQNIKPITLGLNILRAETAAVCGLSAFSMHRIHE